MDCIRYIQNDVPGDLHIHDGPVLYHFVGILVCGVFSQAVLSKDVGIPSGHNVGHYAQFPFMESCGTIKKQDNIEKCIGHGEI